MFRCFTSLNKIRNNIIPILKEINSGVVDNLSRMTKSIKSDSAYLQSVTNSFSKECVKDNAIELERLYKTPEPIVNRALMQIYENASQGKNLETVHITAVKALAEKGVPHSSVSLPANIDAVIEDKKLYFIKKEEKADIKEFCITLSSGENRIEEANAIIFIDSDLYSKNIYKKSILLSIDSAKIKGGLIARSRQSGDKIISKGMHKSVKKLMCDKKIPLDIRSRIPIICDDDGIVAVPFVAIRDGASTKNSSIKEKNIKIYLF